MEKEQIVVNEADIIHYLSISNIGPDSILYSLHPNPNFRVDLGRASGNLSPVQTVQKLLSPNEFYSGLFPYIPNAQCDNRTSLIANAD